VAETAAGAGEDAAKPPEEDTAEEYTAEEKADAEPTEPTEATEATEATESTEENPAASEKENAS
jgi:hypothetical protein